MSEAAIVVAGHICLDVIPEIRRNGQGLSQHLDQMFAPGRLVEIGPAAIATGGAVSNTGLALYKLGVPVQLMGKIGDDCFGRTVIDIVANHDTTLVKGLTVAAGEKSSYSIILSLPNVDRMFLHYPGANDTFNADDIDYETVARARIFHFGYPPAMKRMYENDGSELVETFCRVKEVGAITSLDMVMPDPLTRAGQVDWLRILKNVLPFVDVFMPSIEEMLLMLDPEAFQKLRGQQFSRSSLVQLSRMADQLLNLGASIVALKAGCNGLYLRTANLRNMSSLIDRSSWSDRELLAPCFRVQVADTTGAGDATIAGFLTGVLRGLTPYQTLVSAVATGACSVERVGAVAGIRPWAEMQARVANGWEYLSTDFEFTEWRFDDEERVWKGPKDHTEH